MAMESGQASANQSLRETFSSMLVNSQEVCQSESLTSSSNDILFSRLNQAMICVRRVKKEYLSIMASPVPNITVSLDGEISRWADGVQVHLISPSSCSIQYNLSLPFSSLLFYSILFSSLLSKHVFTPFFLLPSFRIDGSPFFLSLPLSSCLFITTSLNFYSYHSVSLFPSLPPSLPPF